MSYWPDLDPAKSALLLMDFQNTLLDDILSASDAALVLARTEALLASARVTGMTIVHVAVAFRAGHPEVNARNTVFSFVKDNGLFEAGSDGASIHARVAPADDEPVVTKRRIGAFSGTELDMLLRAIGVDTLILAGITTSGVVLSTVRQAFDLDYRLVVVRECCADGDSDVHAVLLDSVLPQHARVLSVDELIEALSADI